MALTVALTGGIASGKGVVAELFRALDVPVYDADVVARDLVTPGRPALAEIAAAFGESMLTAAGELDRHKMRERILANTEDRQRLESILHPRVRAELISQAEGCKATYCVLVVPLFTEFNADYRFVDRVLVVDASPEVQIQRLMQRDRSTREAALQILAIQASRGQRLAIANDLVDNTGPAVALGAIVQRLHERYRALAAAKSHK